jgi:hypothetical protein
LKVHAQLIITKKKKMWPRNGRENHSENHNTGDGMKIKMYQVEAFTEMLFGFNPAAVCLLDTKWLPENIMQDIADENNPAKTAFYTHTANGYSIKWFTPAVEVDSCEVFPNKGGSIWKDGLKKR